MKKLNRGEFKVGVAVHAGDNIPFAVYANHLVTFAGWAKNYNLIFLGTCGTKVAKARNILVEQALEENCTHILFIDADHIVPVCLLDNLMASGADVASGLVCKRGEPFCQVGYLERDNKRFAIDLPIDGQTYEVDICAFGCTLINMKTFDKIEKPWFKDKFEADQEAYEPYNKRSDIIFCEDVKRNGGSIVIATSVEIGHLLQTPIVYPSNAAYINKHYPPLMKASLDPIGVSGQEQ